MDTGPTMDMPGPILFRFAATAEKEVIKSKLSRLTINREMPNIRKYKIM